MSLILFHQSVISGIYRPVGPWFRSRDLVLGRLRPYHSCGRSSEDAGNVAHDDLGQNYAFSVLLEGSTHVSTLVLGRNNHLEREAGLDANFWVLER